MLLLKFSTVFLILTVAQGNSFLDQDVEQMYMPTKFVHKVQNLQSTHTMDVSQTCADHLLHYVEDLKLGKLWALQMFDAGAKLPSGILDGNFVDLGAFEECMNIEKSLSETERLYGKYCIGTLRMNSNSGHTKTEFQFDSPTYDDSMREGVELVKQISLQLAVCLPNACTAADIGQLYKLNGVNMTFSDRLCQAKDTQPKLDGGDVAAISLFAVVLGLMVISTAYDILLYYTAKKTAHPSLVAFSVVSNGKKLIATSNNSSQLSCLHGLRVISTMWIILGHKYNLQRSFPIKNYFFITEWMNRKENMIVMGSPLAVDTFFLMSGLVLAYSYMNASSRGIRFNVIVYYVHRYLRLTPVLAVMVLIHLTLLKHFGSGPLWQNAMQGGRIESCSKYWWKTLLYIQNYAETGNIAESICISQSWYLAVDTQLFVLSPLLLIPLKRKPKVGLIITGLLVVCSMATSFLTSWFRGFKGSSESSVVSNDYRLYYYIATQTRAGPWLMGIILGYFIFDAKQRKTGFSINKVLTVVLWLASLVVLWACVLSEYDSYTGVREKLPTALSLAFIRPIWAAAVGWTIAACVFQHGGPVNWFLSLPVFEVTSKLTYTLYLVHITVIYAASAQMKTVPVVSDFQVVYTYWGDCALSFAAATVLTLAFESPVIELEKIIFGQTGAKKNKDGEVSRDEAKAVEVA